MRKFIFGDRDDVKAVHEAELPPNIKSVDVLLDALSIALRFPDYFGKNWNALDECIRDLSWLSPGDVVLIHEDLPLIEDRASLSIYLSVLRDAVENWETRGSNLIYASLEKPDTTGEHELPAQRKFSVIFPANVEIVVRGILADSKNSADSVTGGQ